MKILTFLKSLFWHIYAGSPQSSQELIDSRFALCVICNDYDSKNQQCQVCGCNINNKQIFMNKLAWRDQKCPKGKW